MSRFAVKTLEFDKVKLLLADKAATKLGKNAIENIRISGDFEEVAALQTETAEMLLIFDRGQRLPFGGCTDITGLLKQSQIGSILEPSDLLNIGNTLSAIGAMKNFFAQLRELTPNLCNYGDNLQFFTLLEKKISAAIDEHGEIKDNASPKLAAVRNGMQTAKNRVKQQLDEILHNATNQKYFQEALVTIRSDRYVIPVKQEYRMNFPGIVHDQSSTGATLFIEPLAVVNLNNDIRRYQSEEKEEIQRILHQLTENVGADADAVSQSLETMTQLDVISARGYLAVSQHAIRPQLTQDKHLKIHSGRHPLLDQTKVVPLTVELGGEYPILLITGPNTGGKTVALKMVGLFALMTQSGMFLPALNAQMPIFSAIYADIGDEQSIEQSLSTFSAHMTNIISILQNVNSGELVLFDELCAGTDPNEGAALAMSILTDLSRRSVLTMLTTHYSELKTFAYNHHGMLNASVEFNSETLMPTYKLLMGVPGSSNAFNISRRLGLSDRIVDGAGEMLKEEHVHMEKVLQDLDDKRKSYEESKIEIDKAKFEIEMLRNQLNYQKREFMKYREQLLSQAKEKAEEIYRTSRREAEEIIKELRKRQNDLAVRDLQKLAESARAKLDKHFCDDLPLPEGTELNMSTVKIGQQVYVKILGKNGRIISVNTKDVTVQAGILRLNVAADQCIVTTAQPVSDTDKKDKRTKKTGNHHSLIFTKVSETKMEKDLRGMLVEEALPVLDKAIDDALLTGIGRLRIIHGKGTGALKAGVQEYLRKHSMVSRMEDAAAEEGGAGVTIIHLK